MFNCDPIPRPSSGLSNGLKHDLRGVGTSPAADGRKPLTSRRPREHECDVVLFGQVWSGDALGLQNDAQLRFEQDTIVVVGPAQDACVYASTELLYHVAHPNRRF